MGPKGTFVIDDDDYAVRGALVLRQGLLSWPAPSPPPAPPAPAKAVPATLAPPTKEELAAAEAAAQRNKVFIVSGMAALLVPACLCCCSARAWPCFLVEPSNELPMCLHLSAPLRSPQTV